MENYSGLLYKSRAMIMSQTHDLMFKESKNNIISSWIQVKSHTCFMAGTFGAIKNLSGFPERL
jgi:hypothetical protein